MSELGMREKKGEKTGRMEIDFESGTAKQSKSLLRE